MRSTMMHPDEGKLQALLDDELDASERSDLERHVQECESCTTELATLRAVSAVFAHAVSLLDGPVRTVPLRPPSLRSGRPPRWSRMALPRAAVLVFGFAAAASAAMPGSPIRSWLETLGGPPAQTTAVTSGQRAGDTSAEPVLAAPARAPESGVSVAPADGAVRVIVTRASPELRVRAILTDSDRAWAIATGDAAGARFETAAGRIEIIGAGAGELRIELPRALGRATVEVDGVPYLSKEGERLNLAVPAEDSAGAEVTFRVRR